MTDAHLSSELRSQAGELIQRGQVLDHAANRIDELNAEVATLSTGAIVPTTGGTTTGTQNPEPGTLLVGCTIGLETVDHLHKTGKYGAVPFNDVEDPAVIRVFYHMDKSTPDSCAPKDMKQPFRAFTEQPEAKDWPWHEKVWYFRLKKLRKLFPNTTFIICTEIAETPDGKLAKFPNRNWLSSDWKDTVQVTEWMDKFITECLVAAGKNFIWQLSSEPWDIDWQWFHKTVLEEYQALNRDGIDLPKLMTPAFPIGQGGDNEFGTNKYWGRSIQEFIPEEYSYLYEYVALHNYALTEENEWDPNLVDWNSKLDAFDNAIISLGMVHCLKACTEFGYDMSDEVDSYIMIDVMRYDLKNKAFSIATIYAYREQGDAHFSNCYLQKRDGTHVDAYDLVTTAVEAAS